MYKNNWSIKRKHLTSQKYFFKIKELTIHLEILYKTQDQTMDYILNVYKRRSYNEYENESVYVILSSRF